MPFRELVINDEDGNIYIAAPDGSYQPIPLSELPIPAAIARSVDVPTRTHHHDTAYSAVGHTHPGAVLSGSVAWDPASIAAGAETTVTVPVAGAVVGMPAVAGLTTLTNQNVALVAAVSAANVVTVTLTNLSTAAVNLAAGTLNVKVFA